MGYIHLYESVYIGIWVYAYGPATATPPAPPAACGSLSHSSRTVRPTSFSASSSTPHGALAVIITTPTSNDTSVNLQTQLTLTMRDSSVLTGFMERQPCLTYMQHNLHLLTPTLHGKLDCM